MNTYRVRDQAGTEYEVDEDKLDQAEADGFLPIVSNGDQEHRVSPADMSAALKDGYRPLLSPTKAAVQPGLDKLKDDIEDGGTFLSQVGRSVPVIGPLGVKAGHAFRAGIGALTGTDAGAAIPGGGTGRSFRELYDQLEADDAAQQTSTAKHRPGATAVAGIVGSAGVPAIGAGMRGLSGAVTRAAGNTGVLAADKVLRDGDLEGVGPAGGLMAGLEALPYVGKAAGIGGKKLGNVVTGVPETATERYLTNPEAVRGAKDLKGVTDEFSEAVTQVRKGLSADSGHSYRILENAPPVPTAALMDPLQSQIKSLEGLGVIGADRKAAIGFYNTLLDDLADIAQKTPGSIGADKGKALIQVLDGKIDQLMNAGTDKQVLLSMQAARRDIDTFLKNSSPAYAEHMKELADSTSAAAGIMDRFKSEDGAFNTLKQIMRGKSPYKLQDLQKFDERFGTSFAENLQNSYAKDAFTRETTQGSRKTIGGSVVGSMAGSAAGGPLGAAVGTAVGGLAGMTADKYGGLLYQRILDGSLAVGRYAEPLKRLYDQRGPAALAAAHTALMAQDPEYKKAVEATEP